MPYLTPDNSPVEYTCRAIKFPKGLDWLAILEGAIEQLTFDYNWEKHGSVTVETAVQEFVKSFDDFCYDKVNCKMVGEIVAYAGQTSPNSNWIPCDGRSLGRSEYPDLYNVIGTTYGSSSLENFMVPNFCGRTLVSIGQGASTHFYNLGETFGEEAHELTVDELATHTHSDTGHMHTTGNSATGLAVAPGELPVLVPNPVPALTGSASANITNTGSGSAHENRQPSIAILYLIVAKEG